MKTEQTNSDVLTARVLYLQTKIDNIISLLFGSENKCHCLETVFPGRKDKFCKYCCYSSNAVLDICCNRTDCERF